MKLSKEELKNKVNEMDIDDEKKIELLEDIEDSMEVQEESTELEELKTKYEELQEKYKARFFDSKSEDVEEDKKEELEEVEEIDVTEI